MKEYRLVAVTICSILILLWAYAAMVKLSTFHDFQNQMWKQVAPDFVKAILSEGLPFFELCIAFFLCFDRYRFFALVVSCLSLAVFTIYIGLAVFRVFPKRPCSCGGIFQHLGWNAHFAVNLVFLILNIIILIIYKRKEVSATNT